MKILQINKFYPPKIGGVEKVVQDLAEGLNEKGYSCDVLCASENSFSSKKEKINGVTVSRCGSLFKIAGTVFSPAMILTLQRIKNNYDIIHLHHPDPMSALAVIFARPEAKIILHWHSDIYKNKIIKLLYKPIQNYLIKKSSVIITTTQKYAKVSKDLKDAQSKTKILYIGIEPDKYLQVDAGLLEKIKKEYQDKTIIFASGRLVPYKGFKYLIDAAKYLDPNKFVILIGGDGPLKQELEKLARKYKNVHLLGKLSNSELASYYAACDIFVLPSIKCSEAFGIVQIEAMYFGKPVISTRLPCSGVDEVNKHMESGLTVEPQNPKEIAQAIKTLQKDKKLYQKLSVQAKERFNRLFTKEKMVENVIKIYKEVLKNK